MSEEAKRTSERIRPELRQAIEGFPPITYDMEGVYTQRAGGEIFKTDPAFKASDPEVTIYDKYIKADDNTEIRLHILEPAKRPVNKNGAVLWLHGGGMTIGLPESDDAQNIRFVKEAGCTVIAPDYRLAPENPYPTPLKDCCSALVWTADHADELVIDPDRIAVAGLSGGGGLTMATAMYMRDHGGPKIAFLMAISPMINCALDTDSASLYFDDPRTLSRKGALDLWGYYLGDRKDTDIYMEPIKDDFHQLPPLYTCAGEIDPFRDDVIRMACGFLKNDIPAELHIYPGIFHASEALAPMAGISICQVNEYVRVIREHIG